MNDNKVKCEPCRTINLAKHVRQPKPDMQIYEKCMPTQKVECSRVTAMFSFLLSSNQLPASNPQSTGKKCFRVVLTGLSATLFIAGLLRYLTALGENIKLPIHPTCLKVCTKDEYMLNRSGKKHPLPKKMSVPYAHGKLMYAVKAGILVGAVYFTYQQGVWGDQQDVTECIRRWREYIRSINTRRPPEYDRCGNVVRKENTESVLAPLYSVYKSFITTCFAGVVKVPLIVKCAYIDYLKALEKKQADEEKERKLKK